MPLLFVACYPHVPPPDPKQQPGSEFCPAAEDRLEELGCFDDYLDMPSGLVFDPETKKMISFADFCEDVQKYGINLKPECLANITECEQIDTECSE